MALPVGMGTHPGLFRIIGHCSGWNLRLGWTNRTCGPA